jgi:hypothetical protein
VLLAALWLLLLVGAIAAFLMARSLRAATELKAEEQGLKERRALASAVETVVADVIFNGPRSRWHMLPASGPVDVDGMIVQVTLTPENGRLDVNQVPTDLMDDVLRGLGTPSQARSWLAATLAQRRAANRPIGSFSELEAMIKLSSIRPPAGGCLLEMFTPFSALPTPRLELAPEQLRTALARAGQEDGIVELRSVPVGATEPIRVSARVGEGRQLNAVVRITGTAEAPFLVHHWSERPLCQVP